MYMNTTYKAFVAKAAASLFTEMVIKVMNDETLKGSFSNNEKMYEHLAIQSTLAADKLAGELEDWWRSKGDQSTVMFDVQDSLTSGIEAGLNDISEKLQDIEAEMEREHDNDDPQ